jgi:hypothetical protein
MKRFRRNAEYGADACVFHPIDRNLRTRVIIAAEALERRTKAKGQKSGVLGQSGLRVLRSLLFDFCAIPTGRCCPSYEAIRQLTGFCYSTISGALRRLETSGLVRMTDSGSFADAYQSQVAGCVTQKLNFSEVPD